MGNQGDALESLKGLGPKSTAALREIGIHTRADLEKLGPVKTFLKLRNESTKIKPSLNFLYAMVGALENRHWKDIARTEKQRLLIELDSCVDQQYINPDLDR